MLQNMDHVMEHMEEASKIEGQPQQHASSLTFHTGIANSI